jgi:hypothetical protein
MVIRRCGIADEAVFVVKRIHLICERTQNKRANEKYGQLSE